MYNFAAKLLLIMALLVPLAGQSSVLTFQPTTLESLVGESFDLDLTLSGLELIDIAYFTVDVLFDPSVAMFTGASFGDGLGDFSAGEALDISLPAEPGLLNFSVQSLLTDFSTQADSLSLATLSFASLAPGDLRIEFGLSEFEDADFNLLDVTANAGNVSVVSSPSMVPVPASLILLASGFVLMGGARTRLGKVR